MSNNAAKKFTFAVTNIVVLSSNKKLLSVFFFFCIWLTFFYSIIQLKLLSGRDNLCSLSYIYKEEHV